MPAISLILCGQPSIQVGAAESQSASMPAKSLALLAFLALEPGPHSRSELTTLLWGEVDDHRASASFRQLLTQLRAVLDGQLTIDRSTVELSPAVPCDVRRFLDLVDSEPEAALAVDVPRFLDGLTLRHCPTFDEWRETTRSGLVSRYVQALAHLGQAAVARRDYRGATDLAERWLQIDPTSEDAAHLQVESLFLAGDRSGALAAYSKFRTRLQVTEDRVPGLTIRELARRIESGRPRMVEAAPGEAGDEAVSRFAASLIGRASEWSALVAAWADTVAGRSRFVIVEGESGIGKSRLAEDFGRWVSAQGGWVLRSQAFEQGLAVPFGPMLEVLRTSLSAPGVAGTDPAWLSEVARILPELRQRLAGVPEPTGSPTPSLLFEAAAELLRAAAETAPIAVVIDDLQWCDQDSCAMLHHLVRRLESVPVLWCATLTPGDLDPHGAASRLARALRASPATLRLQLSPLGTDQVWSLIRELGHLSKENDGRRLAGRIREVTRGNPFYVIELLKMLFAKGWLRTSPDTGEWIVPPDADGELELEATPSVEDAIAQRIARLPDDLHAVLGSIALSHSGSAASVLSHVHGISRLRAATIGDALVARDLAVEEGGRYRCAHPLIARVVSNEMSSAMRREVHRAMALALVDVSGQGGESADPGEIAHHAEQGGELRLGYDRALEASRIAQERSAFDEALGWLDLASACAQTAEQSAAVDRATAALLETADWSRPPARPRTSGAVPTLSRSDVDLPERP